MGREPLTTAPPLLQFRSADLGPPRAAAATLREVSLTVRRGDCLMLLGPNGSGKSTLLKAAAGLWPPHRGELLTVAQEGFDPARVGLVLEDPAPQFVAGTVEDEIGFALEGQPLAATERRARLEREVSAFSLGSCRTRNPRTLSPGEQARCLLAAAAALQPEVLLLDDPFLYLGRGETLPLWGEMQSRLAAGQLGAVLLAGHDTELCRAEDRVVVIAEGRVESPETAQSRFTRPLPDGVLAPWGYRLAERLRARGVPLPDGGWHGERLAERLRRAGLL